MLQCPVYEIAAVPMETFWSQWVAHHCFSALCIKSHLCRWNFIVQIGKLILIPEWQAVDWTLVWLHTSCLVTYSFNQRSYRIRMVLWKVWSNMHGCNSACRNGRTRHAEWQALVRTFAWFGTKLHQRAARRSGCLCGIIRSRESLPNLELQMITLYCASRTRRAPRLRSRRICGFLSRRIKF